MTFDISKLMRGLVATTIGIVTFKIFSVVITDYPQWTTITPGETAILIAVTGIAAIFGLGVLAIGLPVVVTQCLEAYATTESGKRFLERFRQNDTL